MLRKFSEVVDTVYVNKKKFWKRSTQEYWASCYTFIQCPLNQSIKKITADCSHGTGYLMKVRLNLQVQVYIWKDNLQGNKLI